MKHFLSEPPPEIGIYDEEQPVCEDKNMEQVVQGGLYEIYHSEFVTTRVPTQHILTLA